MFTKIQLANDEIMTEVSRGRTLSLNRINTNNYYLAADVQTLPGDTKEIILKKWMYSCNQ